MATGRLTAASFGMAKILVGTSESGFAFIATRTNPQPAARRTGRLADGAMPMQRRIREHRHPAGNDRCGRMGVQELQQRYGSGSGSA